MIYNFESENSDYREFIDLLSVEALDYEVIRKDNIVVRIFGQVDANLGQRLDKVSKSPGKLILKKKPELSDVLPGWNRGKKLIIAGPCSVESRQQMRETARFLSELGISYLRGGAFKPRTNSSSFQGLGPGGLKMMAEVASEFNMQVVTEVMDRIQLEEVDRYADVIQVGSRNMFNYSLLTALGAVAKPVLLKRGMAATIDEWIQASEYIRKGGNESVILCERGIRTFEPRTRFTLDILAVPLARKLCGLPVIVDVSHPAGDRDLVPTLIKAGLAAGADGIMVEVHPHPDQALSDGKQSLSFEQFRSIYHEVERMGLIETSASPKQPVDIE